MISPHGADPDQIYPDISPETLNFLLNIFQADNLVLLQNEQGDWELLDMRSGIFHPIAPEAPEELLGTGYIEENPVAEFNPEADSFIFRVAYEFTGQCLIYLAQQLTFPQALFKRELAGTRGRYTFHQGLVLAHYHKQLKEETSIHLVDEFSRMHLLLDEGELYQNNKGRWRIFYEEGPSVPIRAKVANHLIQCGLLKRNPGLDHYHEAEGYGNCHTLSDAGESLACHLMRGYYDPYDVRLGLQGYLDYIETHPYGEADEYDEFDPHSMSFTLVHTPSQQALYWATLSRALEKDVTKRNAFVDVIDQLHELVEAESNREQALNIQQLAEENARQQLETN